MASSSFGAFSAWATGCTVIYPCAFLCGQSLQPKCLRHFFTAGACVRFDPPELKQKMWAVLRDALGHKYFLFKNNTQMSAAELGPALLSTPRAGARVKMHLSRTGGKDLW